MADMSEFDVNDHRMKNLVQSVAQGDKRAFQRLFDELWEVIYSTGLRLTKSPEAAQDLAQEVFIKLWDNREGLAEVRNVHAYLYIITRNLAHDYLRKQILRDNNQDFLSTYFQLNGATPEQLLENKELAFKLQNAVLRLPSHLREVFQLSYLDGLSHKLIAGKLGITPLTSRVYLVRAIQFLRKELAGSMNVPVLVEAFLFISLLAQFFSK